MDSESGAPLLGGASSHGAGVLWDLRSTFGASLAGLTAALLALLAVYGEYAPHLTDAHVDRYYSYLTDVSWGRASPPCRQRCAPRPPDFCRRLAAPCRRSTSCCSWGLAA